MIPVLLVHGTHAADFNDADRQPEWFEPGSDLVGFLGMLGLDAAYFDPFYWSGDLNGAQRLLPWNWFRKPEHRAWLACGKAVTYVMQNRHCPVPFEHVNIAAHSHGGNGVLHAAAMGLKIRRLLTLATPVRTDMQDVIERARPNIEQWWHVYDPTRLGDRMQVLGGVGDFSVGVKRRFKEADKNVGIPGSDHSLILYDRKWMHAWDSHRLAAFFRGGEAAAAA